MHSTNALGNKSTRTKKTFLSVAIAAALFANVAHADLTGLNTGFLDITNNEQVVGSFENQGVLLNNSTMSVNGGNFRNSFNGFFFNSIGGAVVNDGNLINDGVLFNKGSVRGYGQLVNNKVFNGLSGSVVDSYYLLNNISATINIEHGSVLNNFAEVRNYGVFVNNGQINNYDYFFTQDSSVFINSVGSVFLGGSLGGNDIKNYGIVSVANSTFDAFFNAGQFQSNSLNLFFGAVNQGNMDIDQMYSYGGMTNQGILTVNNLNGSGAIHSLSGATLNTKEGFISGDIENSGIWNHTGTNLSVHAMVVNQGQLNDLGRMYVNDKLTNTGKVTVGGELHVYSDLENHGQVNIQGVGEAWGLVNTGSVVVESGGELNATGVINQGQVDVHGRIFVGLELLNQGSFNLDQSAFFGINTGSIDNQGQLTIAGIFTDNYVNIHNSGTLIVESSGRLMGGRDLTQTAGTLTVDGELRKDRVILEGGVLNGTGTLSSYVEVNGGTIAAGHSPGTLTINGDLNIINGAMDVELGGLYDFDQIWVNGNVHLGGVLNIYAINGYVPALGDQFNFMSFAALYGAFDSIHFYGFAPGLSVSVNQVYNQLQLNVVAAPVPLPGTAWLLGSALLAVASVKRIKKAA